MAKLPRQAIIRFGEFEADLRLRQLTKNGQRVDIQGKPFEVLAVLLEKPGEVVGREQLRNRLWPGVNHGDWEHNLNVCLGKLRHVLSDSAYHPRIVKTISSRGYCFVAPVELEGEQDFQSQNGIIRLAVLPLAVGVSTKTPAGERDFCDGLAVEISADLAHRYPDQIRVIARSSVLKYRDTTKNPAQIGRELSANYLLEITCRTISDYCHIIAQLIRVKDQVYLWAESYDYNSGNPLSIQKEVAERVAQSLGLKLLPRRAADPMEGGRQAAQAHLLYLQGCRQQWEQTEKSLRKSIEYFEQAIHLDPKYAMAYSALANSYSILGLLGFAGPPENCFPKALEAARESLRIYDNLSGPYVSLAIVKYLYEWNWAESEKLLRCALELNPSDSLAHRVVSYLLSSTRRSEEAIAEAWQACELDPASLSANVCLGAAYYLGRDYEQAISTLQPILEIRPTFGPALMWLGACYTMTSHHAEAISTLRKARAHRPHSFVEAWLGSAYARAGQKKQAKAILAELVRLSSEKYISAFGIALTHAALEEMDETFEWLTKAREERCPFFAVLLPADPRLDLLRSDLRYDSLADGLLPAPGTPVRLCSETDLRGPQGNMC